MARPSYRHDDERDNLVRRPFPFRAAVLEQPFRITLQEQVLASQMDRSLAGPAVPFFPSLEDGGGGVLRKVEAFRLGLLGAEDACRVGIGVGSLCPEKKAVDRIVREGFVESFGNLPNLISVCRMVSGPLLGWMIVNELYGAAFAGLVISGSSDWLDGYVARRMNINSVVGSYLDPLADKVLIASVALAMVHTDLLPCKNAAELVSLVVLRDIVLVGGTAYKRASDLGWQLDRLFRHQRNHREKVKPLFISKVNTVFQLALVAAALLHEELVTVGTQTYIHYLSWLLARHMEYST